MINSFAHGGIQYALAGQGVTLDDFYAYMERHNYFYTPTREPWPAASVNSRILPVALYGANGQPILENGNPKTIPANQWLDRHRPVEQITWAPGRYFTSIDNFNDHLLPDDPDWRPDDQRRAHDVRIAFGRPSPGRGGDALPLTNFEAHDALARSVLGLSLRDEMAAASRRERRNDKYRHVCRRSRETVERDWALT